LEICGGTLEIWRAVEFLSHAVGFFCGAVQFFSRGVGFFCAGTLMERQVLAKDKKVPARLARDARNLAAAFPLPSRGGAGVGSGIS
jgi:hypothetical protein